MTTHPSSPAHYSCLDHTPHTHQPSTISADAQLGPPFTLDRQTVELTPVSARPLRPQEARLDQFRLVMNWNRDELAQWALAHAQREDDALALEACRRQARISSESTSPVQSGLQALHAAGAG